MKKVLLFAAIAAATFTSCQKSDVTVTSEKEVNFMIDRYVTRVTTANNVSQFEEGDVIAVTSSGLYADITDAQYTVGANNLTGSAAVYYKYDQTASFTAHYPANLNNVDGAITMTVAADQSSAEKFHNNMFMVATATGSKLNNNVTFKFAHQLSMVKVKLTAFDANSLSLLNVLPEVTWNNGQLQQAAGTATALNSYKINQNEFWVLLPAQTINPGEFISINATDGKVYTFTLGSALTLNTAKVKTITLSINGSEVVMSSALEDVEWTDEDTVLDGKVDGEEYIPVVLLTGNETFTTLNQTADYKQSDVDGWNYSAETGNTLEVSDANELHFTTTFAGSWWKNGAFYAFSDAEVSKINNAASKIFKITFTYRTTAQIRCCIYVDGAATKHTLYDTAEKTGGNTDKYINKTTDTTVSYYVEFAESVSTLNMFIGGLTAADKECFVKNVRFEEVL